jgi:uncharacterized protein Yka (UPF0111/DUF47 family)
MCHHEKPFHPHHMHGRQHCQCACHSKQTFLSKKKRIDMLQQQLKQLEERADDIREFIKELKAAK